MTDLVLEAGEVDVDAAALFSQVVVDKAALARHIRRALQGAAQITLRELCERRPLEQGLAELVAYLELAGERFKSMIDETAEDSIAWWGEDRDGEAQVRRARLPRVIYLR